MMKQNLTEKIVAKLLDKVTRCKWENYLFGNSNQYDLKIGDYKITLWKSLLIKDAPPFLEVKKGDTILEKDYYDLAVKDLYKQVDERYGTVEKERKAEKEKVFNLILTELNNL